MDATHAWVQVSVGTDEGQYRTTNGTTWTKTTPPDYLADVGFTDASNGWAVANHYPYDAGTGKYTAASTIYKTTDGGATWSPWRTTANEELPLRRSAEREPRRVRRGLDPALLSR